jgi:type II secretory pathway pseudopilin PulG
MMNYASSTISRGSRPGITLTEVLISILIMAIGLTSLATLFPIGLLRLRDAQRQSRSAFLHESAEADVAARALLCRSKFIDPSISPWYATATSPYDPWIQDTPSWIGGVQGDWVAGGAYRGVGGLGKAPYTYLIQNSLPTSSFMTGTGLPVAYDPLWRYQTVSPITGTNGLYLGDSSTEGRVGAGLNGIYIRADGTAGTTPASAHGLQRLTNLQTLPWASFLANIQTIKETFVSPGGRRLAGSERAINRLFRSSQSDGPHQSRPDGGRSLAQFWMLIHDRLAFLVVVHRSA